MIILGIILLFLFPPAGIVVLIISCASSSRSNYKLNKQRAERERQERIKHQEYWNRTQQEYWNNNYNNTNYRR